MERKTLAHYRILEKLGEGGMGEVFLAEDTRLGRRVAVKLLTAERAGDPERLGRFRREAQAVAALNHPNIVTLYGIEEEDGLPFLIMELVEGDRLDSLIPQSGRLRPERVGRARQRSRSAARTAAVQGAGGADELA
ncbi:MAG: protein kinase [bacterium]|nr:protein kinase [bacterium]